MLLGMTSSPPPGWYPDPSGAPGQRFFDGQQWLDVPGAAAPTKRKKKWPWVVGGIFVFLMFAGAVGGNEDDTKSTAANSSAVNIPVVSADSPASRAAAPADSVAGIGIPVRDGKFEFVVTKVETGQPSVPGVFAPTEAKGEFVVVHLTVTNIGDREQTFFASNQKLKAGDVTFSNETNLTDDGWIEDLNPGLSGTYKVAFDVPPGTVPEFLEVHDSAFSGGATIRLVD